MPGPVVAFIAFAIVLTGLAVALVVVPLLRRREGQAPVAATVSAVALPASAILFYAFVSNYDWTSPPQQAAGGMPSDMNQAIAQLEQRLTSTPEDVEGWLLLGRSYVQMQRFPDARRAFATAYELVPSNEAKLGLAEVDIMIDRANLGGNAGRLVEEVLVEEPNNAKALFYGGMVAMMRNDVDAVRERWSKVLAMSPPDNIRSLLEQQLAQLGVEADTAAADDHGIAVDVSIAEELSNRIDSGAILFVLARQPGAAGPPIAAIRASAGQLPTSLRISDANAMIAGRTLGGLEAVELVARVSNGGGAIATSGDLYGEAIWNSDSPERAVRIIIDRVVE